MSTRLEVWLEGVHAGQFVFAGDGAVTFQYDPDAPATPISLSLPRSGRHARRAAAHFLENLLPDLPAARAAMARAYGAASTSTHDLLAKAGGDVAGGLVLTAEGKDLRQTPALLNPALDRDIAGRIDSIKRDPNAWMPHGVGARFSLAGTQGKFALAEVDGDWYWSNGAVPSTHIVKPGRSDLHEIEEAEAGALRLAARAGLPASRASVLRVDGQTAFITERFDRQRVAAGLARRLHAEDFAQAAGFGPDAKYDMTAHQAIQLLGVADEKLVREFIRLLAFNTFIGNADAHAKNYSVLLRPDGISLAPLYDSVPVVLYPKFSQQLAMRISGARTSRAVTLDHWRKLARKVDLDEDEMVDLIRSVAGAVLEHNDGAWDALGDRSGSVLRSAVHKNAALILDER